MNNNKRSVSIKTKTNQRRSKKIIQRGGVKLTTPYGTYDGSVNKNNEPHGHGFWRHNNGSTYNGNWRNGLKHGKGVETYIQHPGGSYDGNFDDGEREGFGVYTWRDGTTETERCLHGHGMGFMRIKHPPRGR